MVVRPHRRRLVCEQNRGAFCRRPGREKFPYSGQERPSAAALARRAGPVLAPLRAAGPAAAHSRKPGDPENKSSHPSPGLPTLAPRWWVSGPVLSAADCLHG